MVLSDSRGQAKGQFAFTSKIAGEYKACFTVAGRSRAAASAALHRSRRLQPSREPRTQPAPSRRRSHAPCPADIQTAFHTKLKLDWKTGVAAADWDSIAKKEHLDSLTVEMRKLEGTIREVYNEMIQLQQREQELRDLNGAAPSAAGRRTCC